MMIKSEILAQNADYDIYRISFQQPSWDESTFPELRERLILAKNQLAEPYAKKYIGNNFYEDTTNPNEMIVVFNLNASRK